MSKLSQAIIIVTLILMMLYIDECNRENRKLKRDVDNLEWMLKYQKLECELNIKEFKYLQDIMADQDTLLEIYTRKK